MEHYLAAPGKCGRPYGPASREQPQIEHHTQVIICANPRHLSHCNASEKDIGGL